MLLRIVRFLVGLLLLPVCVAATRTLIVLVASIHPATTAFLPPPAWALIGGFVLWVVLFATLPRPVRGYVLAHELTHALWGSLMGARVSDIRVSEEKGSVTLSKTNFLITLAPYFFPLYTVILVAAYYLLLAFFDVQPYYLYWLGLVGFTWGFHLTFTVSTLMQHQTDIEECGTVFSYAIIYLFNVLGICLWVVIVSSATLEQWVTYLGRDLAAVSRELYHGWLLLVAKWHAINS